MYLSYPILKRTEKYFNLFHLGAFNGVSNVNLLAIDTLTPTLSLFCVKYYERVFNYRITICFKLFD